MKDGKWADTSHLDMGSGSKNKKTYYCFCPKCDDMKIINECTVGFICSKCNKYIEIEDVGRFTLEELMEEDIEVKRPGFHIPNTVLLKFRSDMEEKAYKWRDEQLARKIKSGYEPTHHGPIDEITGKRIL